MIRESQRHHLRAIGIDVWVRRDGRATPSETLTVGDDWETLNARVRSCQKCALHCTRTQTVFGVGSRKADCLWVGEAPGAEEDRTGEPFVGRAGQLLNAMLRAIGLKREDIFIANILKCRPPGNRDPRPEEIQSCEPYLLEQIRLLSPKVIVATGRIAAQNLLRTQEPLGRLRGKVHTYGPASVPMVVTYHPAYLLRSPGQKARSWDDLRLIKSVIESARAG